MCSVKDIAKKVRRQTTDWEEIFAKTHLIKTVIQNRQRALKTQPNNPTKKWAKGLNRNLT